MKRTTGVLLWCGLSLSFLPAQSGAPASIQLGIGVAGRGEEAFVPVSFSFVEAHQVRRISFEFSFPKSLLVFTSATKGPAAKSFEMLIETELLSKEVEDVVRVKLSSNSPIPTGELVQLQFGISEEAHANDEFTLKHLAQTVQTLTDAPLEAKGLDGAIVVVGDAVFGCFFYMH